MGKGVCIYCTDIKGVVDYILTIGSASASASLRFKVNGSRSSFPFKLQN